jgi:pyruvate dehydrogenase E2 component (dihydrolipoamide acetyltransferase)
VETEKGIVEVEVYVSGVVQAHLVPLGVKVPVGTPLAMITEEAAAPAPQPAAPAPSAARAAPDAPAPAAERPPAPLAHPSTPAARKLARELGVDVAAVHGSGRHGAVTRADVASTASPRRRRASPYARSRASELGVDLDTVAPTGPHESIVSRDVEAAAAARYAAAPPERADEPDPQKRMRRAIAASMSRSKREIPHYYVGHTIDLGPALAWLRGENERRSVEERLLPAALLLRAVVVSLAKFPDLNAQWTGDGAPPIRSVNLGVAVSLRGGGLVAPAILSAEHMGLTELMVAFKDVVARSREGRLRAAEMSAATITVTSLGDRGVDYAFPVIIPPQVAMVGFGVVRDRAVVVDGSVVARPTVVATLAADHRVTDGHRGGLFLAAVAQGLQRPELL